MNRASSLEQACSLLSAFRWLTTRANLPGGGSDDLGAPKWLSNSPSGSMTSLESLEWPRTRCQRCGFDLAGYRGEDAAIGDAVIQEEAQPVCELVYACR